MYIRRSTLRALLLLLLLLPSCARSVRAETRWEGKGHLETDGQVRILHLSGSHYEMGLQHGRLLRDEVRAVIRGYIDEGVVGRFHVPRRHLVKRARLMAPHIPTKYLDEMRGIAEGAGLPFEDVLITHTFLESIQVPMCTTFAAWGKATRSGEMIFGRNLDFFSLGVAHKYGTVIFYRPDRGNAFVSVAWPGWCGTLTAVNVKGLGLGLMNVGSREDRPVGIPYTIMVRQIVEECHTIEAAVERLKEMPRTFGNNLMIVHNRPASAVVAEYTSKRVAVRRALEARCYICAANRYLKLAAGRPGTRHLRLRQLIEQNYGRIDETMNFLSDRQVRQGTTLHSALFYPASRRILLSAWGLPASNGPYLWFEYDDRGVRRLPKASPPDRGARPDR